MISTLWKYVASGARTTRAWADRLQALQLRTPITECCTTSKASPTVPAKPNAKSCASWKRSSKRSRPCLPAATGSSRGVDDRTDVDKRQLQHFNTSTLQHIPLSLFPGPKFNHVN